MNGHTVGWLSVFGTLYQPMPTKNTIQQLGIQVKMAFGAPTSSQAFQSLFQLHNAAHFCHFFHYITIIVMTPTYISLIPLLSNHSIRLPFINNYKQSIHFQFVVFCVYTQNWAWSRLFAEFGYAWFNLILLNFTFLIFLFLFSILVSWQTRSGFDSFAFSFISV